MEKKSLSFYYFGGFTILLLIFSHTIDYSFAQDLLTDTIQARQYLGIAKNFYLKQEYDQAITYEEKALEIYTSHWGENHSIVAACLYRMSWYYQNLGSYQNALSTMERVLGIRSEIKPQNHLELAKVYDSLGRFNMDIGNYNEGILYFHQAMSIYRTKAQDDHHLIANPFNNLGSLYLHIEEYDSALYYLHKAIKLNIEYLGTEDHKVAANYYNLGLAYNMIGNHEEVRAYFEQAYEIFKKINGDSAPILCYPLNGIGRSYSDQGKTMQAKEYFQRAANIYKSLSYQHPDEFVTLQNLGTVYFDMQMYEKALTYFEEAKALVKEKYNESHKYMLDLISNIGNTYQYMGDYDQASVNYESYLRLSRKNPINLSLEKIITYNNLARLYRETAKYSQALKALKTALNIASHLPNKNPYNVKNTYLILGSIYQKLEQEDRAILAYQKLLCLYDSSLDSLNFFKNPVIEKSKVDDKLMITLYNKAYIFQHKYLKTQQLEDLKVSFNTFQLAIQAIDIIRADYSRRTSKEDFLEGVFPIYEDALETAILLWKHTNEKNYIKKAYLISEKSKSVLLHEAVQTTFAREQSRLPDSLLKKETSYRLYLAHFEKLLMDEMASSNMNDSVSLAHLQDKVFYYRRSHDSLLQVIERQHPDYHQLMYDFEITNADNLQAFLPNKSALIQYFWGDSSLYTFILTSKDILVSERPLTVAFKDSIQTFVQQFANIQQVNKQLYDENSHHIFIQYAYHIYLALLGKYLSTNIEQLIIIPDGLLSHLPFELLLTESYQGTFPDYSSLSYLIKNLRIRYEYSATLLNAKTSQKKGGKLFAGFAPAYNNGYEYLPEASKHKGFSNNYLNLRDDLSPLRYNQPEVEQIATMFKGDAFIGDQATESSFKANSTEYQLLHLAMHTVLDDSLPLYSGLVFTQEDSLEDGYLYTSEIYNLSLKADLAILSACETGLGKMLRGEGMMSLARAFKYAGTPNIVTSLWKVDDQATQQLMQHFYTNLQDGMPKDKALQNAKLRQIAEGGKYAHPAFWSSFVLIGDDRPIRSTIPLGYKIIGFLLICTIVFVGIGYYESKIFQSKNEQIRSRDAK